MCCLKFSKNIAPFAITFILGIFIAGLFNCFTGSNKVYEPKVNEVKVYSSMKADKKCIYDEETNSYSLQKREEKRIINPTFEQTIIINRSVEKLH